MPNTEKNQINKVIGVQNETFEVPNDVVLDGLEKIATPLQHEIPPPQKHLKLK